MACARAVPPPPSGAKASAAPRTSARLARWGGWQGGRRIEAAEVLEHQPALLGRETTQVFPGRVAQPRARARRPRGQDPGEVDAVADCRAAGALLLIVGLGPGECPARVEQAAVHLLLPLDRGAVEPARVELAREIAGLLSQRACRRAGALGLQPLELLRQRALSGRERAQLLQHRLAARPDHRQQALGVAVQSLLSPRHAPTLLHRFLEAAPGTGVGPSRPVPPSGGSGAGGLSCAPGAASEPRCPRSCSGSNSRAAGAPRPASPAPARPACPALCAARPIACRARAAAARAA